MLTFGVLHHGLTVSDLDRSIRWYCEVFDLVEVHRQTGDNEYTRTLVGVPGAAIKVAQLALTGQHELWPSSHFIELIEYVCAGGDALRAVPNQPGSSHLAFVVSDIETVCARVIARGGVLRNDPVTVTAGINKGSRACYLHDPDGHILELMQYGREREAQLRGLMTG
ncbi:VOC family protein [Nocardioides immobilis]|nr:VOC family protein [Nocardioides immobilis]